MRLQEIGLEGGITSAQLAKALAEAASVAAASAWSSSRCGRGVGVGVVGVYSCVLRVVIVVRWRRRFVSFVVVVVLAGLSYSVRWRGGRGKGA